MRTLKKAYDMVFASYNYLRPYVEKIKLRLKDDQKNDNEKVSYLLGFRGKTIRVLYILLAIYNNRETWVDNKKFNENFHIIFENEVVKLNEYDLAELINGLDKHLIIKEVNNAIVFLRAKVRNRTSGVNYVSKYL